MTKSSVQNDARIVTEEIINAVLESSELYDILPGDGDDDYILGKLRQMFKDAIKERYR
jgi:hypothetical protein